jgi:hypothetical protein
LGARNGSKRHSGTVRRAPTAPGLTCGDNCMHGANAGSPRAGPVGLGPALGQSNFIEMDLRFSWVRKSNVQMHAVMYDSIGLNV